MLQRAGRRATQIASTSPRPTWSGSSLNARDTLTAAIHTARGDAAMLLAADFAQDGGAERLAAEALAATGQVDVLLNNAGGSRPMPVHDDPAVWA